MFNRIVAVVAVVLLGAVTVAEAQETVIARVVVNLVDTFDAIPSPGGGRAFYVRGTICTEETPRGPPVHVEGCLPLLGLDSPWIWGVREPGVRSSRSREDSDTQAPGRVGTIDLTDGLLTVSVQDVPLKEVLEEVARQSDLTLEGHASMTDRVTILFDRVPFESGLHLLVRGQRYLLVSDQEHDAGQPPLKSPRVLRIFPGGGPFPPGPVPRVDDRKRVESSGNSTPDIPRLLAVLERSDDTWEEEDAILALGHTEAADVALPLSRLALTDEDPVVRVAAIHALVKIGGDEAARGLALALQDEEPQIRRRAVEALRQVGGGESSPALGLCLGRVLQDRQIHVSLTQAQRHGGMNSLRSASLISASVSAVTRRGQRMPTTIDVAEQHVQRSQQIPLPVAISTAACVQLPLQGALVAANSLADALGICRQQVGHHPGKPGLRSNPNRALPGALRGSRLAD